MSDQKFPDRLYIPPEALAEWHEKAPGLPAFEGVCVGDPCEVNVHKATQAKLIAEAVAQERERCAPLIAARDAINADAVADAVARGRVIGWREAAEFVESTEGVDIETSEAREITVEEVALTALMGIRAMADKLASLGGQTNE